MSTSQTQPPVYVAISEGENAVVLGVFADRELALDAIIQDVTDTFANPDGSDNNESIEACISVAHWLAEGNNATYTSEIDNTFSWSIQVVIPDMRRVPKA